MNHLAHLVLAGPAPDHRLGALLGDHVKGNRALEALRPQLALGVRLHRRIDTWSDRDPAVRAVLARLERPWRRYGGIILDVLFDHALSRHWDRFVDLPLHRFAERTDALLASHADELPPRLGRFACWARRVGLWQRFGERGMLDEIFARLAARHGRREPLAAGTVLLDRLGPEIDAAFLALFPRLQARAAAFLTPE